MKSNTTLILQHILWRGLYFSSILLLNICIARYFAAEKSGQIFFIINNLALILLLVSMSLESGSAFYVASGKLHSLPIARFCAIWAILASGLALTGWYVFLYFSQSHYLQEPGFMLTSFLFILGVLCTTYFTALFYAEKEFVIPNKILTGVNFLLVGLIIAGKEHSLFKTNFLNLYFSSFFLQGILLLLFFFKKNSHIQEPLLPAREALIKLVRYSLAALLANGIYFLVNRIDYWFVQYYCPEKDLGNYIQASKLSQMLFVLPSILGSTLFPIFSSREKSASTPQLMATMRILGTMNAIICLLICSLGWYIFPLVFGGVFR